MPTTAPGNEVFPTLQYCGKLVFADGRYELTEPDWPDDPLTRAAQTIYDVHFYPYATTDNDQIFAIVADTDAIICRPRLGSDPQVEILRWFRDQQEPPASFNSLVWTKDPLTKNPVLCIAGSSPKHIKILDVQSGQPIRALAGHGKGINDLAISPLSTKILASGAEDNTIRLWNLDDRYQHQPCVAIFSGEGHKSPVLAIHFHPNGRWMLSGAIDTAVCLWAVPELGELERNDEEADHGNPKIVYYPHFFSKELHSNYVDCLQFYGDLIISRCSRDQGLDQAHVENEILIWKIDGFDSNGSLPAEPPIPVPGERTRSSFQHDSGFRGFQRLLTLDMPFTDRFYLRFGLLHAPDMRPILAMGNQNSTYCFWDLQMLDEGIDPRSRPRAKKKGARKGKTAPSAVNMSNLSNLRGAESAGDGTSSATPEPSSNAPPEREYTLNDRFKPIKPHHSKMINTSLEAKQHFATRSVAWSPDGTWLVGVGDLGMLVVFHRDKGVIGSMPRQQNGAT